MSFQSLVSKMFKFVVFKRPIFSYVTMVGFILKMNYLPPNLSQETIYPSKTEKSFNYKSGVKTTLCAQIYLQPICLFSLMNHPKMKWGTYSVLADDSFSRLITILRHKFVAC